MRLSNILKVIVNKYVHTQYSNGKCIDLETGYITDKTRTLGLAVLRGTAVILISPFDGSEEIENPFLAQ